VHQSQWTEGEAMCWGGGGGGGNHKSMGETNSGRRKSHAVCSSQGQRGSTVEAPRPIWVRENLTGDKDDPEKHELGEVLAT